jgi:uncharacterized protein (DUF433 family)
MAGNAIVKNQDILGGVPIFRHTRVPFQALLDYLEGGQNLDDFLKVITVFKNLDESSINRLMNNYGWH